eukprot:TRINITY_DN3869_c1_g4_i3.p1 TRINITY_DN3869_c1_g4~~TRINITY_DN3869_c1_g4_i3.p1  ORF type:complete len:519 (-),score=67.48 TRINITY_DN3869_c1_g4_i3:817-2373(-)
MSVTKVFRGAQLCSHSSLFCRRLGRRPFYLRKQVVAIDLPRAPDVGQSKKEKSKLELQISRTFRFVRKRLANFRLALAEMVLLAALSGIGSFIDQYKDLEFYQQEYGEAFGIWIKILQLDHIYLSWYFLGLMALLAASLAACTRTNQLPSLKLSRRWRFVTDVGYIRRQDESFTVPGGKLEDLGILLMNEGYQIFCRGGCIYGFKGLAAKAAPIGVHASMILILIGVAIGAAGGYKGTVNVPIGGEFVIAQAISPSSFLARYPEGAKAVLELKDFEVSYRPDGSIAQYYSEFGATDLNGKPIKQQTISVNKPWRYGGVTMYQTDWGMAALTLTAKGCPYQPEDGSSFNLPFALLAESANKLYGTFIPAESPPADGSRPRGVSVVARDFQSVVFYDSKGEFAGVRRLTSGKPIEVEGLTIVVSEIIGSSGVEIKSDPGVPYVYAGFGILMVTTLLSYSRLTRVWGVEDEEGVHVGGFTNKAKAEFSQEMQQLMYILPQPEDADPKQEYSSYTPKDNLLM